MTRTGRRFLFTAASPIKIRSQLKEVAGFSQSFQAYGKYARNLPAKLRSPRSGLCDGRSVKPSAQPALVRTQHLPPREAPRSEFVLSTIFDCA
jgi:hypothetical protein